jgi:hypothetical protein
MDVIGISGLTDLRHGMKDVCSQLLASEAVIAIGI